jgi:hypothetical protein
MVSQQLLPIVRISVLHVLFDDFSVVRFFFLFFGLLEQAF